MPKRNWLFGLAAVVLSVSALIGGIACGDENGGGDQTPEATTPSDTTPSDTTPEETDTTPSDTTPEETDTTPSDTTPEETP